MRKIFIIIILAACLSSAAYTQRSGSEILWNDSTKLLWSDFKGRPSGHSQNSATTFSSIHIGVEKKDGKIVCLVECAFSKEKSWVRAGKENEYLLNHEQRHFDITEIYARKIRQAVSKVNFTDAQQFQKDVLRAYDNLLDEYRQQQALYDQETKHSMEKDQQAKWDWRIDTQLKSLEAFRERFVSDQ